MIRGARRPHPAAASTELSSPREVRMLSHRALPAVAVAAAVLPGVTAQDHQDRTAPGADVLHVAAPDDDVVRPDVSSTRLVVAFATRIDAEELDRHLRPLNARVLETGYGSAFEVLEVPDGTMA